MNKRFSTIIISILGILALKAANPMATDYTYDECQGSLRPYPTEIAPIEVPDSLTPVFINHVGRHGARYPASATNCLSLKKYLQRADSAKTITPLGRELLAIVDEVIDESEGRWGALNSLGEEEQRGIASRMYLAYPDLFSHTKVRAISSYSPRCMMSMFAFTHQLDRMDNHVEFSTLTGRVNNDLMRPFDISPDYKEFRKGTAVPDAYDPYFEQTCPLTAINRVMGNSFPWADYAEMREAAITEYYVLAGMEAMMMECDLKKYFNQAEMNSLWSCFNLRQYLQRTATTLSPVPADIASALLQNLIDTTDDFISGKEEATVLLRFGHAETLMPLLSLMRLPGCYYLTNYFDTVALHWCDFDVVPMAANLQMALFKTDKGKYYMRIDLNEKPVPFIPNSTDIYIPWEQARQYLSRCMPWYL